MVDFRQKYLKYFLLEKKWGFKNQAIIGGLENIIDPWKTESAQNGIPIQIINSVSDLLHSYRNLEIIQRQKVIDQLIDLVSLQNNTKIQSNTDSSTTIKIYNHRRSNIRRRNRIIIIQIRIST